MLWVTTTSFHVHLRRTHWESVLNLPGHLFAARCYKGLYSCTIVARLAGDIENYCAIVITKTVVQVDIVYLEAAPAGKLASDW